MDTPSEVRALTGERGRHDKWRGPRSKRVFEGAPGEVPEKSLSIMSRIFGIQFVGLSGGSPLLADRRRRSVPREKSVSEDTALPTVMHHPVAEQVPTPPLLIDSRDEGGGDQGHVMAGGVPWPGPSLDVVVVVLG